MRKRSSNSRNNNTVPGFLSKTYKILENPDYKEIISWNEDGKDFKVKKPNEFAEKILPKYFKTNNFASFVRQLNMYDFHKLRHDSEENEWRHSLFKRGYPNLLCEIKRKIHEAQIQEAAVAQLEQNKITSDTQYLLKEMESLKQKQDTLEQTCSVLIAQNDKIMEENTHILGENKHLWDEINKKKEKSYKKIEKLLSLILNYLSRKQIPELAFLNGKKSYGNLHKQIFQENIHFIQRNITNIFQELLQSDYMKQEYLSDESIKRNSQDKFKRSDEDNIENSLFNSNKLEDLNKSFNGGLNSSSLLNSQNNEQIQMAVSNDQGKQFAQKLLDKFMTNLYNNHENNPNTQEMEQQKKDQLKNFVDNNFKQDQHQNLANLMNSKRVTNIQNGQELNQHINKASINLNNCSDQLQKHKSKIAICNSNLNMNIDNEEEFENIYHSLMKKKKVKKNEEEASNQHYSNINFRNIFNSQYTSNNPQLEASYVFNVFEDYNGVSSINNKTSLDISKFFNNDFQQLALPHSINNQQNIFSIDKKRRDMNSISQNIILPSVNNDIQLIGSAINKSVSQLVINDSILGLQPNRNTNATSLYSHTRQQLQQWDDLNTFIAESKIEKSLRNIANTNKDKNLNICSNNKIEENNQFLVYQTSLINQ